MVPTTAHWADIMIFRQLFEPETSTYTYLLGDEASREAIIIDPVLENVERDILLLTELGLTLTHSIDTHVHADHVTGSGELRRCLGVKTVISSDSGVQCADINATHGQIISFGVHQVEIRLTPGHTSSCMSLVFRHENETIVFTGDTLLIRGCGRTDFQQGSAAVLYQSVHQQIYSLPDSTKIYPGHDYHGFMMSTVAEEKAHNPRLNIQIDQAAFMGIMNNLNLSHPKKIKESLPANMACGEQFGET